MKTNLFLFLSLICSLAYVRTPYYQDKQYFKQVSQVVESLNTLDNVPVQVVLVKADATNLFGGCSSSSNTVWLNTNHRWSDQELKTIIVRQFISCNAPAEPAVKTYWI
jgi:hypothetical protein